MGVQFVHFVHQRWEHGGSDGCEMRRAVDVRGEVEVDQFRYGNVGRERLLIPQKLCGPPSLVPTVWA